MFILVFVVLFATIQATSNKMLHISSENKVSYVYSKRNSLVITILALVGILLQVASKKIKIPTKVFWILVGIYAFSVLLTMVILSTIKKLVITKQREEMQSVFEVLEPVLPKGTELNLDNPPFKLEYENSNINHITIAINPNTFKEAVATNLCLSLNKYLPNYEWLPEFDFAKRECHFVGAPLPPDIARYKGSWLRPAEVIPIGLSGQGEVAWVINSVKDFGKSMYMYEDGKIAQTVDMPSAPQCLCVGSPLGLSTIIPTTKGYKTMETIVVGDEVFDINNKPVKVLGKSDVFKNHTVYHLRFVSGEENVIDVIADSIHKFPVEANERIVNDDKVTIHLGWEEKTVQDLIPFVDRIIGRDPKVPTLWKSYALTIKEQIDSLPVQCVLVDSDSHLFLITDEMLETWKGGKSYPYKAIYTRNTGGGKAICSHQIIEIKE